MHTGLQSDQFSAWLDRFKPGYHGIQLAPNGKKGCVSVIYYTQGGTIRAFYPLGDGQDGYQLNLVTSCLHAAMSVGFPASDDKLVALWDCVENLAVDN